MKNKIEAAIESVNRLLTDKQRVLIAIDGRCAAGKTTLATHLQGLWECNVFHMDDFFLRPTLHTPKRLNEPGGNIEYERFLREVMLPLQDGRSFAYHPYDCKTQRLKRPVVVQPHPLSIIEGSYSCHPTLWDYYDLHIFLTVEPDEQLRRITLRNGTNVEMFQEKWIPLEERYFGACQIEEHCELIF